MFYFVGTQSGKIVTKSKVSRPFELPERYREISKDLYDTIGSIPCSFTEHDGGIVNVEHIEYAPELFSPEPTEILELQQENKVLGQQMVAIDLRLLMGGM